LNCRGADRTRYVVARISFGITEIGKVGCPSRHEGDMVALPVSIHSRIF